MKSWTDKGSEIMCSGKTVKFVNLKQHNELSSAPLHTKGADPKFYSKTNNIKNTTRRVRRVFFHQNKKYIHMAFIRVPDCLIWPDEAIWHIFSHDTIMQCIIFKYFAISVTWLGKCQIAASAKIAYYPSLVLMIISLKLARNCLYSNG